MLLDWAMYGDFLTFAIEMEAVDKNSQGIEVNIQIPEVNVPEIERPHWKKSIHSILMCLLYSTGLGNVWRAPYIIFRNGGCAFLIPFFIMLIFVGLPIFYLELYIGQYTGLGPLKAFASISPFFSGLGYCTLVVISIISIYYMIIVAWTLFYTIASIAGHMGWGSCDNDYNTDLCYSGLYDSDCRQNNTGAATDLTYYLRQCISIGDICERTGLQKLNGTFCLNGTEHIPWYANVQRVLASEEYYTERVLGRGDASWNNWGSIQWHLVGCLALSWLVAFFCVIKGVQSAGKVVYFTAIFPYVMLTALLIRGATLEGAAEGLLFYLSPEWGNLLKARVWGDAASQIFYSFGVACGSLVTLASYNNFYNNCHFDAVFVSFANFFTSIYAGFAIFTVLGFQAQLMGVSVDDVAADGPGLAFVAYPEAILQMPIPQLWAILFFFMLFILGLGSQFGGIEAINTAIVDQWPQLREKYWKVTGFTCFTCFILGLPMCFSGGVFLFELLDWNTASWAILLIGIGECTAVAWSYGINRAISDLATMDMKLNKYLRFYWKAVWTVILPLGSFGILIFVLANWERPSYNGYEFPLFADLLGWAVGLSTLVLFPIGLGWAVYHGYIFYSFGVACGSLVTLASYNNFYNNCHFDAVFVSFANFFTSIYAGFAIFTVLGFQAQLMGVSVDDVAADGPGLAFVAYPEAILQMPIPQLWAILFFFMLFILGLGSQFGGIEAINTAIVDQWPQLREKYWKVTGFTCFTCFILGLPMCFSGGVFLFELLDWNTASWAILLIGIGECTAVAWSYGINRAISDLATMDMKLNKYLRFYWKAVWTVILPLGSFGILIFVLANWERPSYNGYEFPLFADLLGWAVGLSTLVLFPIGLGWAVYHGYRGKNLFKPTSAWKPAVQLVAARRSEPVLSMNTLYTGQYDNIGYTM